MQQIIRDNSLPTKHPLFLHNKLNQMKKITIIILAVLFFTISANSQITKGNWLVGGSINFSSNKLTSDLGGFTTTTFEVAGNAGYFFIDKLVGGVRPNIFLGKTKTENADNISNRSAVGPFLRYYFLPEEQKVNMFLDGGYSYGRSKVTGQNAIPSHSFYFMAGPVIFLNTSVALELFVGYSFTKSKDGINSKKSNAQAGLGLQFHLEKQ